MAPGTSRGSEAEDGEVLDGAADDSADDSAAERSALLTGAGDEHDCTAAGVAEQQQ